MFQNSGKGYWNAISVRPEDQKPLLGYALNERRGRLTLTQISINVALLGAQFVTGYVYMVVKKGPPPLRNFSINGGV